MNIKREGYHIYPIVNSRIWCCSVRPADHTDGLGCGELEGVYLRRALTTHIHQLAAVVMATGRQGRQVLGRGIQQMVQLQHLKGYEQFV